MGIKWDGFKFDQRLAMLSAGKLLTLGHLFCWTFIELLLLIVMVDPHWTIDANDYSCGLFRCVHKGEGESHHGQWIKESCGNQSEDYKFICTASKTGSVFILMAFFHIILILLWNTMMLVRSFFSLPYIKIVPSPVFNSTSVCLDLVASILICLTWVIYLIFDPFHGVFHVGGDFIVMAVVIWPFTFGAMIFSIARMVVSPSDEGLISFSVRHEREIPGVEEEEVPQQ